MEILTETPLQLAVAPWRIDPPHDSLTVVAKGTFDLAPDARATWSEEPRRPTGDEEDDTGPRYPSDFAPFKPRADLLLAARAHAPGGAPVTRLDCSFQVGARRRTLVVFGDREWRRERWRIRRRASPPAPFREMPLGWDRAFGGERFAPNPLGRGRRRVADEDGARHPLPNVEDPAALVRSPRSRPEPAGFGPLAMTWPRRARHLGRYRRRWQRERAPWLPSDFDWSAFNAAAPSMQVEGYLRGDEPIRLENLHPGHPVLEAKLPGLRVRCFLEEESDGGRRLREVAMNLDTLFVDVPEETLVLVWRGTTRVRSFDFDEIASAYLVVEDLHEAPADAEHHRAGLERLRSGALPEDAAIATARGSLPDLPGEAELDARVLAETRQAFAGRELPPPVAAALGDAGDGDDLEAKLLALLPARDAHETHRSLLDARARTSALLAEHGLDASILEPLEAEGPADWTRERVAERCARGESLAGQDLAGLDLSRLDLRRADLSGAILRGANLAGADLELANLSRAQLAGADLGGATLPHARLEGADLTGAALPRAQLRGARLDGALLVDADLSRAVLSGASAGGAVFLRADLSDARLETTSLEGADLSETTLDRAVLRGARLQRVSLDGARGEDVDFTDADLTRASASATTRLVRGTFCRSQAAGSSWISAALDGADWSFAKLPGVDFSKAMLEGAVFHGADLAGGDLTGARLAGARLTGCNLFEASLIRADARRCPFDGASLYGASFADARLEDASFAGARRARAWIRE